MVQTVTIVFPKLIRRFAFLVQVVVGTFWRTLFVRFYLLLLFYAFLFYMIKKNRLLDLIKLEF